MHCIPMPELVSEGLVLCLATLGLGVLSCSFHAGKESGEAILLFWLTLTGLFAGEGLSTWEHLL